MVVSGPLEKSDVVVETPGRQQDIFL